MSDSASDTPETVISPPETRNRLGLLYPRVSSPTLVPSARPSSSRDHVISLLEQAAAGKKAQSKQAADRAPGPSTELQNAQNQPQVLEADVGSGDRSQDTLKLLQELARKSSKDERAPPPTPDTPAARLDTTLPSYLAVVGTIDQLKSADQDAKPQPPARGNTNGKIARVAIAGCSAILAAGMTGLFLWSQVIPAQFRELRSETDVAVAEPTERSAVAAARARPDTPSVQAAMAECDLAAAKNPFAVYFLVTPNAINSNLRQGANMSGEDYGWYSLMSLKARLERRGGAC